MQRHEITAKGLVVAVPLISDVDNRTFNACHRHSPLCAGSRSPCTLNAEGDCACVVERAEPLADRNPDIDRDVSEYDLPAFLASVSGCLLHCAIIAACVNDWVLIGVRRDSGGIPAKPSV